jgi:hypothetical protein
VLEREQEDIIGDGDAGAGGAALAGLQVDLVEGDVLGEADSRDGLDDALDLGQVEVAAEWPAGAVGTADERIEVVGEAGGNALPDGLGSTLGSTMMAASTRTPR